MEMEESDYEGYSDPWVKHIETSARSLGDVRAILRVRNWVAALGRNGQSLMDQPCVEVGLVAPCAARGFLGTACAAQACEYLKDMKFALDYAEASQDESYLAEFDAELRLEYFLDRLEMLVELVDALLGDGQVARVRIDWKEHASQELSQLARDGLSDLFITPKGDNAATMLLKEIENGGNAKP
jgi:hypothetical protein